MITGNPFAPENHRRKLGTFTSPAVFSTGFTRFKQRTKKIKLFAGLHVYQKTEEDRNFSLSAKISGNLSEEKNSENYPDAPKNLHEM